MTILLNTDSNVSVSEEHRARYIRLISEELSRFGHQITRVDIHLSDENGDKEGLNDKRCMIEIRIAGMKPFAVTNNADNHDLAIEGAVDQLKTSLDSKLGRLKNSHHG
jgi:ribosome-associated translation inhibitor RaiA